MRALLLALPVVATLLAAAGPVASGEKKAESWPRLAGGWPVRKTFRFKPAGVEYAAERRRHTSYLVIFRIKDDAVPADLFAVSRRGFKDKVEAEIEKLLAADGGHITVEATWVNMPVDVYEPGSVAGRLIRSRLLVGELRWPAPQKK